MLEMDGNIKHNHRRHHVVLRFYMA